MPSLDLSSDKLQPGDYVVDVKGGGLSYTATLPVWVHDLTVKKALAEYKKTVAKQQKEEKNQLKDGVNFVGRSYVALTKAYRATRTPAMTDAKRKWDVLIKSWKKEFEQKAKDVKAFSDRNRNNFAYPDQLSQLRSTEQKLVDVYRSYDRSLKAGREIASDATASSEFKLSFRELQKSMGKVK